MQVVTNKVHMSEQARRAHLGGRNLALVPTMGALHEGHLALVKAASETADHVTVSIFVNPTQFGIGEDLDRYPNDLEGDLAKLNDLSVDVVFAPSAKEMYPDGAATTVRVDGADAHLCGPFRPGHFEGVTTVVAKLFSICQPDSAVFGLKDAQQYLIIQRMVRDLGMGIDLVGVSTVRESDGLALSSRNSYLSAGERDEAVVVCKAVFAARDLVLAGERNPTAILTAMQREIEVSPRARLQYAEIVDTTTITPVKAIRKGQSLLAATAVYFGDTRLIDNQFINAP